VSQWKVQKEEAGCKLLAFLASKLDQSARSIKRGIDQYRCKVNGRCERFATTRLSFGDRVSFDMEEPKKISVDPKRVLWEDSHCLIYNKPAGMLCDTKLWPGCSLVHRLDKNTTGAWLLAKSKQVEPAFSNLFRGKKIDKRYLVIVDGVPKEPKGNITGYIGRISDSGSVRWGVVDSDKGSLASTDWEVVSSGVGMSLIRCRIHTGKTHQIRVHLSSIGLPIVGDWQYHDRFRCGFEAKRPLLHAHMLSFKHPITGEEISVEAQLPQDLLEAIAVIGKGGAK